MDTESPVPILVALGEIEDRLAEAQESHAQLAGRVKRGEKFFKAFARNLEQLADEGSAKADEAAAWSIIHEHEEWGKFLDDVEALGEADTNLEYEQTRATICQSALKQIQAEMQIGARHGQEGQGQWTPAQRPSD